MTLERWQLVIELVMAAILAAVSTCLFNTTDALSVTIALAIAYAIPRILYTRQRWCTHTGRVIFLLLGAMMTALAVLTIWNCTVKLGLPLSSPYLTHDDGGYYRWALHHYDNSKPLPGVAFIGFPLLMLMLWKVLGVSIVWPLAMNVTFTLLTAVITAATTRRLLRSQVKQSDAWLATMGLLLTATLMYFLSQGLRIQKESMVYLAMALAGYVLAGMNTRANHQMPVAWRDIVLWAVACIMLGMGRTTYLYFLTIGLVIVTVPYRRANWRRSLWMVTIVAITFAIGNLLAKYSVDGHIDIVKGGYYMQKQFMGGVVQQPYLDMIGKYFYYPVWHRLLILPLACSVQFIIPFPWLYDNFSILSYFPRIAFGWYAVGGLALFYYFTMSWRRGLNVGAWGWWPATIFVIIGYVVAGTVSRYLLPAEPLTVPLAVYVIARLREGAMRHTFRWWATAYVIILITTLVVCYHIQLTYLQDLDNYYKSLM